MIVMRYSVYLELRVCGKVHGTMSLPSITANTATYINKACGKKGLKGFDWQPSYEVHHELALIIEKMAANLKLETVNEVEWVLNFYKLCVLYPHWTVRVCT